MIVTRVTITGADDHTEVEDLVKLSAEFPFVEWGILFSPKRQGMEPRYPSHDWLNNMCATIIDARKGGANINMSAHLCGLDARTLLCGNDMFFRSWGKFFQRIQINGYTEDESRLKLDPYGLRNIIATRMPDVEFIMQVPTVDWFQRVQQFKREGMVENVAVFFDPSGGVGKRPSEWPLPISGLHTGYAGGIGPSNVESVVTTLTSMKGEEPVWIDMESGVRTQEKLDLDLVRTVLVRVAKCVG